ncbi:MAG: twin-arginine translocase subunit TatC [Planctomycetes bacterium]|jgi:sec-independent protein translocase protein TatC|nr:twin-arginine translocase subunit TatC [Planctomycetota bacterium]
MSNNTNYEAPDPEDMFAETRMSFGDHIEELRWHLIQAIKGLVIGMVISIWPLGPYVLAIIVDPVEDQLFAFEKRKLKADLEKAKARNPGIPRPEVTDEIEFNRDEIRAKLGLPPLQNAEDPVLDKMVHGFEKTLEELEVRYLLEKDVRRRGNFINLKVYFPNTERLVAQIQEQTLEVSRPRLKTMHITEAFFVYFKISLMTGLVLSSPWVFYQIWAFIAAGLYPHERRLVNVYLPFSLFLFLSGVILCQFFVMPRAVAAMLWFNEWLGMDADLRLNEWLGFALMMPIVFGLSFQTPLVMMFAHKIGVLSVKMYRDHRRIAWFVMAIFAAVITPTVDPWTMLFLWFPMGALYELGILLCVYQGDSWTTTEWEQEEKSNELVEV